MVIFIGGLIGTGKTSLAQAVAKKLGIYYYEIDLVKKEIYPTDPDYEYNLKNNRPFSEKTKIKTFNRVVRDFAKLAKKHKHIIVDETLRKQSSRQILFDGAEKYFEAYMIVLVKADEATVKNRLAKNQRPGHILKNPVAMYLALKGQFEDFEKVDIIFENDAPLAESGARLAKLIRARL